MLFFLSFNVTAYYNLAREKEKTPGTQWSVNTKPELPEHINSFLNRGRGGGSLDVCRPKLALAVYIFVINISYFSTYIKIFQHIRSTHSQNFRYILHFFFKYTTCMFILNMHLIEYT